jgi:glycosyltransferase involved in cell wall biosynthesis
VVATRVGGLPEVIEHGVTGFLHPPDDLDGMAASVFRLLADGSLHRQVARAARRAAHERFCDERIVPVYEAYYEEILRSR